ncbi:MAG TPA: hypothetical protein VK597_03285, partial [Inquilinus sp.]|nr:hypothetical protein [Inquilinus sp.]
MATFTGTDSAEILPTLVLSPVLALGNDFVDALGGNDLLLGWTGDDVLRGGAGADVLVGGLLTLAGVVTLSGVDTADYTTSLAAVNVDLSVILDITIPILGINVALTGGTTGHGGDAEGDFMVGITNLIGSDAGGDTLGGSGAANQLSGLGGDDTLSGQGGNDVLL